MFFVVFVLQDGCLFVAVRDQQTHKFGYDLTESEVFQSAIICGT